MSVVLSYRYFTPEPRQQKSSVCNYTNFIGNLTNLEKLSGDIFFTKFLSFGIESCHCTLVFHHPKDIEFNDVNFEDKKEILVVARLITGAPNLHKPKISTNLDSREEDDVVSDSEAPDICLEDFGCEPNFKFEKLRFVRMDDVSGFPSEVDFLEFFLESSPMLESMTIVHTSSISTEEKESLMNCSGAVGLLQMRCFCFPLSNFLSGRANALEAPGCIFQKFQMCTQFDI